MPDPRPAPQLRQIALSIRDWIGPFYTLGAVVAFVILLLSALDPSGALVLWVRGVLLGAAALSWLLFFGWRRRAGPLAQRFFNAHGHWVLSLVAVFFAAGLVVSHRLQQGQAQRAAQAPAPMEAAAPTAPPPMAMPAPVPTPPVVSTASTVPTAATRTLPDADLVDPAPVSPSPPVAKLPVRPEPRSTPTPPVRPPQHKTTVEASGPVNPRCQRLVQRSGLGELLSGEEIAYLRSSCGG
jgi:hypothetical protein